MINQRTILNDISPDFCRDNQSQEEYIRQKSGQIVDFVARYTEKSGAQGIVLGISGGIDSFLAGALCAKAMQKTGGKLHLVLLPNGEQADYEDARQSAAVIREMGTGVVCDAVSIARAYKGALEDLAAASGFTNDIYTLGNLQPRIRMMYQYALAKNMLVAGTDHATEAVTGFYTKYGDGGTDINPIQELVKDDIYEMSRCFGAPDALLTKRPAAGLGISADDESELGIRYDDLCAYLKGRLIPADAAGKVEGAYTRSMHKRALPASLKDEYRIRQPYTLLAVGFTNASRGDGCPFENAEEALRQGIGHINRHPEACVLYVKCNRPRGAALPDALYHAVKKTSNTPLERYNVFCAGADAACANGAGLDAVNPVFGRLRDHLAHHVTVMGAAAEYCILQTVKSLLGAGHSVTVLKDALGYADKQGYMEALEQMEKLGARVR